MLENNEVFRNPKLHKSHVSSNENLRRSYRPKNLVDYSEIEEASVSDCSQNAKHDSNSGINETPVLVCALVAKHDNNSRIKEASVSVCIRNANHYNNSEIKEASPLLEQPGFVKLLCKANTMGGFLLSIPVAFSERYLPEKDTTMMLETDKGEEYEAKYLPRHNALSGGWRKYATDQNLVVDDAVVFQLVEPTRFKVHIIRKGSSTVKLPTTILNVHSKSTQSIPDKKHLIPYERRKKPYERTQRIKIHFSKVTGFVDFNTTITKLLENHELSEVTLSTYYELCRANNTFLHTRLIKGLNTRFFGGPIKSIISKTVSIAIALTASTLSSFLCNFLQWNNTLKYYEALGMNVAFLLSRVRHLRNLAVSSEGAVSRSRYMEACRECPRAEFEVKKLEIILGELRKISLLLESDIKAFDSKSQFKYLQACSRLVQVEHEIRENEFLLAEFDKFFKHYHDVIEKLKIKVHDHDRQFQEAVSAPW